MPRRSEMTAAQIEKQRVYQRNYYTKKMLAKAQATPTMPVAIHTNGHSIHTAMLTVETIQTHTTALRLTNGATVGQAIDGYLNALQASGVKVRTVTLSLPET